MKDSLSAKARALLALGTTLLLVLLGTLLAPRSPALGAYTDGLEHAVLSGLLILAVAMPSAVLLGSLAASGPRVFDAALRFACDLFGSLPTVFVAAVLWAWSDRALGFVCAMGALRGLEQAWLLRCEIVRLEAEDPESVPHGLGRTPLRSFWRLRLPAALGPLFVSASFSVAWLTALDAALTQAGLRPHTALPTWGSLLGSAAGKGVASPSASLLAAGSVALLTVALHALFRPPRPAALRSSTP